MATTGDKLATRITLMIQKFNDGARLSVEELAEEFDVSVRTVQRDLERFSFLPIEKEHGKYFLASYALGKLGYGDLKDFSTISGISELYPKLDAMTIADILNPVTNQALKVQGHNHENLSSMVDAFDALGGAIIAQRKMAFEYGNKSRNVEPYKLMNNNGIWYLVAIDDGTLKHFTFSKIKHLSKTNEHFEVDDNVVDAIEQSGLKWMGTDSIDVVLRIDVGVSEYFLRRELLPCQEVVEENEDYLMLKAKVTFEEELLRMVRYWIPHIHITSPANLQEKLENSLTLYLTC